MWSHVVATKVGVRELKERATEVMRRVRENGEEFEVTYRGQTVARIIPVGEQSRVDHEYLDQFWKEWDELAAEIGSRWPPGVSALDAIREDRGRLGD